MNENVWALAGTDLNPVVPLTKSGVGTLAETLLRARAPRRKVRGPGQRGCERTALCASMAISQGDWLAVLIGCIELEMSDLSAGCRG